MHREEALRALEAQGRSALLPGTMAEQGPKQPWAGALLLWIPLLAGQGRGPGSAWPHTPAPEAWATATAPQSALKQTPGFSLSNP